MRPAGAELFHADGQTDKTKVIVAFRNFANAPKKELPARWKFACCLCSGLPNSGLSELWVA